MGEGPGLKRQNACRGRETSGDRGEERPMRKGTDGKTTRIAVMGIAMVMAILTVGAALMGQSAKRDAETAARSVSMLYLDELAGRREQVVENNLKNNIKVIQIALGLIEAEDMKDLPHMQAYQRDIKQLFSLQRFAFVDTEGLIYTADEGVRAEDMAVNSEIMVMVLGMREIDTDVAENGRIAVEKFTSHEAGYYDAILMDMRMPEMDGLEATMAIRASGKEDAKTIPIIALTANAFDEDVQRSLQAGLNAHLSKPVEPDTLFETLEKLIS